MTAQGAEREECPVRPDRRTPDTDSRAGWPRRPTILSLGRFRSRKMTPALGTLPAAAAGRDRDYQRRRALSDSNRRRAPSVFQAGRRDGLSTLCFVGSHCKPGGTAAGTSNLRVHLVPEGTCTIIFDPPRQRNLAKMAVPQLRGGVWETGRVAGKGSRLRLGAFHSWSLCIHGGDWIIAFFLFAHDAVFASMRPGQGTT